MKTIQIDGADVLLFRDGKPFGETDGANIARSLPLPLPGTLAGAVRSFLGDRETDSWSDRDKHRRLEQIAVHGPLLHHAAKGTLFPAPADLVRIVDENGVEKWMPLLPGEIGGCDLPGGLVPLKVTDDGKPDADPLWDAAHLNAWLLGNPPGSEYRGEKGPPTDARMHVGIDSLKNKAEDSKLFGVHYLDFGMTWSILTQVGTDRALSGVAPLGGERRLGYFAEPETDPWPRCPDDLTARLTALDKGDRVRMVLATPALFSAGWKPGWLKEQDGQGRWFGNPPIPDSPRLTLIAAAVPRRVPVSGWHLREGKPKPVRWAVPAGAVYFFEVVQPGNNRATLANAYLKPVSDNHNESDKDRRDGYGLAVWGV